jgi:pimeloyl-ACP methyl ester carboxylesterase
MREQTTGHVPAHSVRLPDGRALAYAEYGDPNGHPTLYFHGLPGSRLEAVLAAKGAAEAGIRLIASDRPGIGGSDPQDGRTLLDWPADVLQLADHIGLARFAVVGVSGGGPYAAVCAYAIPERLDGVAIVSGVAPFDQDELLEHMVWFNKLAVRGARMAPSLITSGLRPAAIVRWFPRLAIDLLSRSLDVADREVLARTEVKEAIARSLSESLRQGARANARELVILARPWGFRLEDVLLDVYLWHGERDRIVPASHGRSLCRKLSRAHFELLAVEGHFSLVIDHVADIFSRMNSARLASAGHSRASVSERLEE